MGGASVEMKNVRELYKAVMALLFLIDCEEPIFFLSLFLKIQFVEKVNSFFLFISLSLSFFFFFAKNGSFKSCKNTGFSVKVH